MLQSEYTWINYVQARAALAQRLSDTGNVFWTDAENGLYLQEALRTWGALTEIWNMDFSFTATPSMGTWISLQGISGYPRVPILTDSNLYTMMQYHLLEQPTGGNTWTGTSQFSLAALQAALQRRRDEVIQVSGCNLARLTQIPVTPNTWRVAIPDTVLEPRRMRFLSVAGDIITLTREDASAWDHFEPDHLQTPSLPASWGVDEGPPLVIDLDVPVSIPGNLDPIALVSGPTFAPPALTPLGVPDDWSWLVKWGALADLLSLESEATDLPRAKFCEQMYMNGLKIMKAANWLIMAEINGVPVDIPSMAEMDQFDPEWEENEVNSYVVTAGTDLIAPCPVLEVGETAGVTLTVVGNAPVPANDTDYVQIARDNFDAVLSYAQALAMFKQGGSEFLAAQPLIDTFFDSARRTNARLAKMGLFFDVLTMQGKRQEVAQPR